jgi:hypothetical protein
MPAMRASCFNLRTWERCPLGDRLVFFLLNLFDIWINSIFRFLADLSPRFIGHHIHFIFLQYILIERSYLRP